MDGDNGSKWKKEEERLMSEEEEYSRGKHAIRHLERTSNETDNGSPALTDRLGEAEERDGGH